MAMYFVQHGIAVDKSIDPDRPLSDEGRQGVEKMAGYLSGSNIRIAKIYHSGKTRAEQTAAIFADALGESSSEARDLLNPMDDVEQLIPQLEDNCMYVGHLPHLQRLVARLLCGDQQAPVVSFENAGVICVSHSEQTYTLEWLLKPSIL